MNILHLIDSVEKVNFGIWNAALINSLSLKSKGWNSYATYPNSVFEYPNVTCFSFRKVSEIDLKLKGFGLSTENTIIVSHGCWGWPTRVGLKLKKQGYKWVAVPHGMLEPWSMNQKSFKKRIYWNFIEKWAYKKADIIRAVGKPEYKNLDKTKINKLIHIANGVDIHDYNSKNWNDKFQFLFMARLHHKKGILPLAKSWIDDINRYLKIAGPDDGEKKELLTIIENKKNVEYLGPIYGNDKLTLLKNSHFYILPSFSEGFPSSVVEAMSFGLIPIITEGCNFPEVFDLKLGFEIKTDENTIKHSLENLNNYDSMFFENLSFKNYEYVKENLSIERLSSELHQLYFSLLFE